VKRHVLVVGPARRQRRYLFVDFGPVRPRGHTPTATPGRSRPRIVPHERSESIVYELQDNQAADLAVRARDEAGNVVPLDGVLEWSVSGPAVSIEIVPGEAHDATP
jgi:hypothetical protein